MERPASSPAVTVGSERLANTLAALALAIDDRVQKAVERRFGVGASAASALVVLAGAARPIESLSREVGLSHSAAVRLVDRLEEAGLAARAPGADRRSLSVGLTPAGKRRARAIVAERERVVSEALSPLGPDERRQLSAVVDRVLGGLDLSGSPRD